MNTKELLAYRKFKKKRKPDFVMQDAHKKKKLKQKWRKPRGIDSKMRLKLGGYRKCPQVGYASPKEIRGLHPTGLKVRIIARVKDLETLDLKKEGVMIGSTVGMKKRCEIIKKALELKAKFLNVKEPEQFIKNVEEKFAKKKEDKQKKKKETEKKSEEKKKTAEESKLEEKIDTEVPQEDKKEQEKKEFDKLLTTQG